MMRRHKGFTLIEMMITVAIVAILTAIAVPAYSKYVQRARRSDAINAIQLAAAAEEKYYFQHNTYATTAQLGLAAGANSSEKYYNISVDALTNIDLSDGYTLIATPAVGSPQAQDTDCQSFRLDAAGVKDNNASGAAYSADTKGCWHR